MPNNRTERLIEYIKFSRGTSTDCFFVNYFSNCNFEVLVFVEEGKPKKKNGKTKGKPSKQEHEPTTNSNQIRRITLSISFLDCILYLTRKKLLTNGLPRYDLCSTNKCNILV